jgi:hypothetical protein
MSVSISCFDYFDIDVLGILSEWEGRGYTRGKYDRTYTTQLITCHLAQVVRLILRMIPRS